MNLEKLYLIYGGFAMYIFSNKANNLGRQTEIDLSRGFAAILLAIVHVGLYLGNNISKGLWVFCDIIGSEPCAPVFMALMGIGIAYSRHQDINLLLKRGIRLLIAGYALNLFRSLLPFLILGNVDGWASVEAFFVVDILQLAGLSFMLIALLKKMKLSNILIFMISIVMVVLNQFITIPDTVIGNSKLLTGLINLFCPVTGWSCFPLFTWFAFPAFGLVFGELLAHCTNKKRFYGCLLPIGLCTVIYIYYQFYRLYPDYTSYYWNSNYYNMGLKNVLLTLLFICFTLSFWFFMQKILPNFIKAFLGFLSKNLNTYYIFSWIIISVLIHAQALFGWQFGTWATIGIMVLLIFVCALLTKLWISLKRNILKKTGNG